MGGRLDHAAGIARRADTSPLTGKRDQVIVAAVSTAGASEAVGEDAAFEVTTEFPLDVGRSRPPRFVLRPFEPGGQMRLYGAVEHGAFRLATTIGGCA